LFTALIGLLLIALAVAMVQWRCSRRLERKRRAQDDRLLEYERIAGGLHDMLVQSTLGFMLTVQAAASKVPRISPARLRLDRALDRAEAVLLEARDRVETLRAHKD
jgi:hypothetical protein